MLGFVLDFAGVDHSVSAVILRGFSPQANYTNRANTACRPSECQLLRIDGVTWSAQQIPTAVISVF
jgi:hypothetical protein